MESKIFQCYLIVGDKRGQDSELSKLLNKFKITLADQNPDNTIITPETKSIKIGQIRELKKQIFLKPLTQKNKVIIIKDAHTLTIEAQNSLLKILEEPPNHAIIILLTTNKSKIINTIISRVVKIECRISEKLEAEKATSQSIIEKLLLIPSIENAQDFINLKIEENYAKIKSNIAANQPNKISIYQDNINLLKESKKMVDANVNKVHVLANFFLNEKNDSK